MANKYQGSQQVSEVHFVSIRDLLDTQKWINIYFLDTKCVTIRYYISFRYTISISIVSSCQVYIDSKTGGLQ